VGTGGFLRFREWALLQKPREHVCLTRLSYILVEFLQPEGIDAEKK